MKCALVFTGLLRSFEQAYPAFKQYVIDRYETDVYFDIWTEVGFYSGKEYIHGGAEFIKTSDGDRGFSQSGELVDVKRIIELYNPREMHLENFSAMEWMFDFKAKRYSTALTRPKNTLAQAYKVLSGMTMVALSQIPYDIVVRARPDIVLERDPGYFFATEFVTLSSRNSKNQGTGDSLQIGSLQDMIVYSDLLNHVDALYDDIGYSCPHMYAKRWIEMNNLFWHESSVGAHVAHSRSGVPYQES